jgi:probable HAF family extracellular repeat protein
MGGTADSLMNPESTASNKAREGRVHLSRSNLSALIPGLLLLASCAQPAPLGPDGSLSAPPRVSSPAAIAGTDLGTLGGQASYAQAINKWGTVVGYSNTASGDVHAFRWTTFEGMVDLGTLPGDVASGAVSILTTGRILGWSRSAAGTNTPVTWDRGDRIQRLDIPPLPDAEAGMVPTDFNERGQVIGYAITPAGQRGWFWSRASGTVDLEADIPSCLENYPSAINIHGQVVGGYCVPTIGWQHAFLWQWRRGYTDLGIVGEDIANTILVGLSLNDFGRVVGWISTLSFNSAYMWSETEGFTLLPSFGGLAYATGINRHGIAVGAAAGGVSSEPIQAVAWPSVDDMVSLTGVSPNASVATAVNDRGQAVGWLSLDNSGSNHAMLWEISSAAVQTVAEGPFPPEAVMGRLDAPSIGNTAESCLSDQNAIVSKAKLMQCILKTM